MVYACSERAVIRRRNASAYAQRSLTPKQFGEPFGAEVCPAYAHLAASLMHEVGVTDARGELCTLTHHSKA